MSTRKRIMKTAEQLFMTKGYETTSVQNIIEAVGIAKGTFYYYFKSKDELLEAITSNEVEAASKYFYDAVINHEGNAIEKANLFFQLNSQWKVAQIDLLYTILVVLFSDKNFLYLKKVKEQNIKFYSPIFNLIIKQGIAEGVFNIPYSEGLGEVIIQLSNTFSDSIADIMLHLNDYEEPYNYLENKINVFAHCFERLLGVESGMFNIIDEESLKEVVNYIIERSKDNDKSE